MLFTYIGTSEETHRILMTSPIPPFTMATNMAKPPLPAGWTEHVGPGGIPYYFNSVTKESTYTRPPPPPLSLTSQPATEREKTKKEKKEKPKTKTPIPGTPWLRIITTLGNVFYTHTERKESVWTVPDEIKEAISLLEEEERKKATEQVILKRKVEEEKEQEVRKEVERIKREVEADSVKRKAEEPEVLDENVATKKIRIINEESAKGEEEEQEEDWEREAAVQLAAEAEELRRREEDEKVKREMDELKRKEKEKGTPVLNMPSRVDLSIDEAKALFKTLLREKDINPLLPWDTALPKFVTDPRYVLLPSVSARREAFDEYCKERARELRQAKIAATAEDVSKAKKDPKAEFEQLLHEEVKSTRTSWTEWRRTWKKDSRFYNWGRDDREREKRFRDWLRELGEQKRKAAQKAEADFFALLKEKNVVSRGSSWRDVKRGLDKDPRYDAVGSSSLREELFNTFVKTLSKESTSNSEHTNAVDENGTERKLKDKERKDRAIREREQQVRRERGRVESQLARSRSALSREESELEFMTLLTDAIREPTATWDSSVEQLKRDPRYNNSSLPHSHLQTLFSQHVDALRKKYLSSLHAIFTTHAPQLSTGFDELPKNSIQSSHPAQMLGLDANNDPDAQKLEKEYQVWCTSRHAQVVKEFQEMLNENSFIDFWGRVRKMREKGRDGMKVEIDDEDLIGENGDEDKVDLKALAQSVDVQEIERVLKNDKRYTIFDHIPEEREKWIRTHIEKLAAPKLSVHVPEGSH